MQKIIQVATHSKNELIDISDQIMAIVTESGIATGMVNVYVQGATAGIMIQENWDNSVQRDVISLLNHIIPEGVWQHDHQDNNGAAHLKSGLVGPGETIPLIDGKPGLSTWQNVFLCEFDGPKNFRKIVVTVLEDN